MSWRRREKKYHEYIETLKWKKIESREGQKQSIGKKVETQEKKVK